MSGSVLQIGVVTLFPELFSSFEAVSFVGRARKLGLLELCFENLRDHGLGRHRSVDDTPYGGGSGMVLRVDCLVAAVESLEAKMGGRAERVLLTPQGVPHNAALARELGTASRLLLICGRYEGFDERVRDFVDREVSLGDFVLTGGEVAAMALIESAIRFVPGVLGNEGSTEEESFSPELDGGLEYPQYTRPAEFRGLSVPDLLKGGDHEKVRKWRLERSRERTLGRRPDLRGPDLRGPGFPGPGWSGPGLPEKSEE
jgi:tRNA (guanine37-N1)-methyltransferase